MATTAIAVPATRRRRRTAVPPWSRRAIPKPLNRLVASSASEPRVGGLERGQQGLRPEGEQLGHDAGDRRDQAEQREDPEPDDRREGDVAARDRRPDRAGQRDGDRRHRRSARRPGRTGRPAGRRAGRGPAASVQQTTSAMAMSRSSKARTRIARESIGVGSRAPIAGAAPQVPGVGGTDGSSPVRTDADEHAPTAPDRTVRAAAAGPEDTWDMAGQAARGSRGHGRSSRPGSSLPRAAAVSAAGRGLAPTRPSPKRRGVDPGACPRRRPARSTGSC